MPYKCQAPSIYSRQLDIIMAGDNQSFERNSSAAQHRRLSLQFKRNTWLGPPSDVRVADHGATLMNTLGYLDD